MNPSALDPQRQLLRDLAIARAGCLRRRAIHDFWAGLARTCASLLLRVRRRVGVR
jgi:hypothetical protein